MSEPK